MGENKDLQTAEENQITGSEFNLPPTGDPGSFNWNERVTRKNFVSWLETSFRVSRGEPMAQYLFFQWSKVNLSFDYNSTFKNITTLDNSNGYSSHFSTEEIDHFGTAIRNVKKHQEKMPNLDKYTNKDLFDNAIWQALELLKTIDKGRTEIPKLTENLFGMEKSKFIEEVTDYIKTQRPNYN